MSKDLNREKALAALLECNTLTEAAERAGIARRTLYGYMRNDAEFAKAYKAAQERLQLEQVERITATRDKALETIVSIMENKTQPAAIRLKAAQSILEATEAAEKRAETIANINVSANSDPFSFSGFGRD